MSRNPTVLLFVVSLGLLLPLVAGATPPTEIPIGGRQFGSPLTQFPEPTPIREILREPDRFAGQTLMLRGRITDVCQKKGCWTVITDGEHSIRVRFEDYSFFLPSDSIGLEAWALGRVNVATMSESDARHYEAESRDGKPESIHGPQREIGFTATGVRLVGGS